MLAVFQSVFSYVSRELYVLGTATVFNLSQTVSTLTKDVSFSRLITV